MLKVWIDEFLQVYINISLDYYWCHYTYSVNKLGLIKNPILRRIILIYDLRIHLFTSLAVLFLHHHCNNIDCFIHLLSDVVKTCVLCLPRNSILYKTWVTQNYILHSNVRQCSSIYLMSIFLLQCYLSCSHYFNKAKYINVLDFDCPLLYHY